MSTTNKVLLACFLVVLLIAAVVLVGHRGGQVVPANPTTVASVTPAPAAPTATPATGVRRIRPTPVIIVAQATPAPAPGATPADEATQMAAIRDGIMNGDATRREEALGQWATLLTQGKGVALMKEFVLSGNKDYQDDVLSLLPNLPEDDRIPLLNLALDAKDPEFRTDMLTQVRDVISSDPQKAALNDLIVKAMKDPDPSVVEEAADLFMYFGDAENDGPLYTAATAGLASDNETVRDNAMSYLEDNHTVQSILALTQALNSKYPDIVEKAGDALRFITDADISSNKFDDWAKWCRENGEQWGKENDRTLP